MKIIRLIIAVILVCSPVKLLFAVGSGGFMNQVVGTKALGAGNAFVAQADDPSAIYFNPAGLNQLPGSQISLGGTILGSDTKYTSTSGQSTDMENETHFIPNFYVTHRFSNDKFAAGIGFTSPFGLSTEWSNTSPLRYVATKSKIKTYNINPSVSYQINPAFSFGFGVDYMTVDTVELDKQLNVTLVNAAIRANLGFPPAGIYPDGSSELKGDADGWGYNLGVLYKPLERHQFGASYRSQINTTIEGKTTLTGLADESAAVFGGTAYETNAKSSLNFPQSLLLGYAYKPTNKWTFEMDYEWVGWSSIDETKIDYSETNPSRLGILNTDNPTPRSWQDSNNVGLGGNYKINDTWDVRGGYWYFERVVPNRTFDPSLPENTRNALTLGASLNLGPSTIDFAYNAIFFRDRNVDNSVGSSSSSSVDGKYETFSNLFAVNYTYRFSL